MPLLTLKLAQLLSSQEILMLLLAMAKAGEAYEASKDFLRSCTRIVAVRNKSQLKSRQGLRTELIKLILKNTKLARPG